MQPLILTPSEYDPFLPEEIRTKPRLEHVIALHEQKVLDKYKEPINRPTVGRFSQIPTTGSVQLIGFEEVIQAEVDAGTNPPNTEVGDINVNTTDADLLFALRSVVAELTERFYNSADGEIERLDQGDRTVLFDTTRSDTPARVFRPLRRYDATEPFTWL